MNELRKNLNLRELLDLIEAQTPQMGEAYGEAFLYLMHKDIHERLELHLRHVQQRIPHRLRNKRFV